MRNKKTLPASICGIIMAILMVSVGPIAQVAQAASTDSVEFKKAIATALSSCYALNKNGDGISAFRETVDKNSYNSKSAGEKYSAILDVNRYGTIRIPDGYGIGKRELTCAEILDTALRITGNSYPSSITNGFMTLLGYEEKTSSASGECIYAQFKVVDESGAESRVSSEKLCTNKTSGGLTKENLSTEGGDGYGPRLTITSNKVKISCTSLICKNFDIDTWDNAKNEYWNIIKSKWGQETGVYYAGIGTYYLCYNGSSNCNNSGLQTESRGAAITNYQKKDVSSANTPIIQALVGSLKYTKNGVQSGNLYYTKNEKFALYQNYLVNYYGDGSGNNVECGLTQDTIDVRTANDSSLKQIHFWKDGSLQTDCLAKATKNKSKKVVEVTYSSSLGNVFGNAGLTSKGNFRFPNDKQKEIKVDGVLSYMASAEGINLSGITGLSDGATGDLGEEDGAVSQTTVCMDSTGPLGWVICPVISVAGKVTSKVYDGLIKPFLIINNEMVSSNGSAHSAWKSFRDFANIGFAIALLIVVLSQLTGIGLNNYNIKKILPKLIVVVILVNASFLICQIAVDATNLVGDGVRTLFRNLIDTAITVKNSQGQEVNFYTEYGGGAGGFVGQSIITRIMEYVVGISGGVALTIGAAVIAAESFEFWIVPFLVALIGFLIATIFFFVILAARQAGIIILVVLSPLAVLCYALPNTKNIFDKWYKAFIALLLVYPIAELLMSGGDFVSALMLAVGVQSGEGFFILITAALISVVPFFFIPSLVKNSMMGLGNLGAKISGFGQNIGGLAGRGLRGSRFADNMKETGMDRRMQTQLRRDTRRLQRLQSRYSENGELSQRQRMRAGRLLGRAAATEQKIAERGVMTASVFGGGGLDEFLENRRSGVEDNAEQSMVMDRLAAYNRGANQVNMQQILARRDDNGNIVAGDRSVESEYRRQLQALMDNPEDRQALRNVRALQTHLATQSENGQEAIRGALMDFGSGANLSENATNGLRLASQYIQRDGRFLGAIKDGDRSLFSMVNDFGSGDFSHTGANMANHYVSQGLGKLGGQQLANYNDAALDRLADGVRNGNITGDALQNLMGAGREALSNDNINLQPATANRIHNMMSAGFAQGANIAAETNGNGTAGSRLMASSSAGDISSMVNHLANSSDANAREVLRDMAQNARIALLDQNARYSQEQVSAMQDAINTANRLGITNAQGNAFQQVDSNQINIDHSRDRSSGSNNSDSGPGLHMNGGWDTLFNTPHRGN